MALYAQSPGKPVHALERNDSPFYTPAHADVVLNLCVDCFHDTATEMRTNHFVNIRGTGVLPNKPVASS